MVLTFWEYLCSYFIQYHFFVCSTGGYSAAIIPVRETALPSGCSANSVYHSFLRSPLRMDDKGTINSFACLVQNSYPNWSAHPRPWNYLTVNVSLNNWSSHRAHCITNISIQSFCLPRHACFTHDSDPLGCLVVDTDRFQCLLLHPCCTECACFSWTLTNSRILSVRFTILLAPVLQFISVLPCCRCSWCCVIPCTRDWWTKLSLLIWTRPIVFYGGDFSFCSQIQK